MLKILRDIERDAIEKTKKCGFSMDGTAIEELAHEMIYQIAEANTTDIVDAIIETSRRSLMTAWRDALDEAEALIREKLKQ